MIEKDKKTIGILGGGQLGKMLSDAAIKLGFNTHIYSPDVNSPAFRNATYNTIEKFEDKKKLKKFIDTVDLVTIEFENIPLTTIEYISQHKPIYPPPAAIEISQDRLKEKDFFIKNKIKTNNFKNIESINDLNSWTFDRKSVLKTRRFGYDGKGQKIITSLEDAQKAYLDFNEYPCLIEEFVEYTKEVSTISARDTFGNIFTYLPSENIHKDHILDRSFVPASISKDLGTELKQISSIILSELNYIGILSIEFFVRVNQQTKEEELIANEIAPRVHNSGHWTLDGSDISQFEQHIKSIVGKKINEPKLIFKTEMLNIIGEDINYWNKLNSTENKKIYLYGKDSIRKGRKMGHVNFINKN
ncbi:MAG: 5-(carboxyamino)imidazole ribonucleotide synthase [Hyphomicrobiales bacterium]|nr:5-(carboxyamino)imidazole ribonucleotide synthase [Hyphomicrobiales bacterium]